MPLFICSAFDQPSDLPKSMQEKTNYVGYFPRGHKSMNASYHGKHPNYQRGSNTSLFGDRDGGHAGHSSAGRSFESNSTTIGRVHDHFQFQSPAIVDADTRKKKLDRNVFNLRPLSRRFYVQNLLPSDRNDNATSTNVNYGFSATVVTTKEDKQLLRRLHMDDADVIDGQRKSITAPNEKFFNVSSASCNPPYTDPMSIDLGSQVSISCQASMHSPTTSGSSTINLIEEQKSGSNNGPASFVCECCPLKKKWFETLGELITHEAEKQRSCSFCGNRFKNRNEAGRHENSVHVRRHSWSCSALSAYDKAFHDSVNTPGEADTCGYCGDEFPRSGCVSGTGGLSGNIAPLHATKQDWDERIRHLQEVHEFRQCNSSKKFFRADHFRQHLKYAHGGKSGKWNKTLENACILEVDPTLDEYTS
jgi:hypothetical protein